MLCNSEKITAILVILEMHVLFEMCWKTPSSYAVPGRQTQLDVPKTRETQRLEESSFFLLVVDGFCVCLFS